MTRHFLKSTDFTPAEIEEMFALARVLKEERPRGHSPYLRGQTWAMLFDKSSTRTRVSFEVGIHELGGHCLYLDMGRTQLGRGESLADTARVLSRYVHGLIVRTYAHETVVELAREGTIPVVNGLTDLLHPCQVYTDVFTLAERWAGPDEAMLPAVQGRTVAFLGDTDSNMAHSWILMGALMGMKIRLAGPERLRPSAVVDKMLADAGLAKTYHFTSDPREAVAGADAVYTDVWVSMGAEGEKEQRVREMAPFQVTLDLFRLAQPDAYFLHCLPAHEGEEVATEVLRHPRSIVFDEAENRLHLQKALLITLSRSR